MRGVLTFVRYCIYIYIANYLDDWLICTPTEQQARSNTKVVLAHLQNLGPTLNSKKKSITVTRVVTYLGLSLNSTTVRASLTPQRQSVLKECLSKFLKEEQFTVKSGWRLLGLVASQVVPLGLLHMRPLQRWLAKYKLSLYENGQRLSSSNQVVALNSRPEKGSQVGPVMFKGDHNNRCLTGRLGYCVVRQSNAGKTGCLMDRSTWIMGTCSRGVSEGCTSARRGQCSSRPFVQGRPHTRRMATSAVVQAIWLRLGKAKSGSFCLTGNHTLSPVVFRGKWPPKGQAVSKQRLAKWVVRLRASLSQRRDASS